MIRFIDSMLEAGSRCKLVAAVFRRNRRILVGFQRPPALQNPAAIPNKIHFKNITITVKRVFELFKLLAKSGRQVSKENPLSA